MLCLVVCNTYNYCFVIGNLIYMQYVMLTVIQNQIKIQRLKLQVISLYTKIWNAILCVWFLKNL